ncbi:hypothetical protein AV530_004360 [Patagioenas fasciata monilis]|uniref:Uncharacterized protein n=1 Tax=Patagioenas fasciata monilis TaxID=372326 RepID=A0A1V4K9C9_PATFA|nr:hypothetical protein AV530_004360 [Patagioenas fasciata monilis]
MVLSTEEASSTLLDFYKHVSIHYVFGVFLQFGVFYPFPSDSGYRKYKLSLKINCCTLKQSKSLKEDPEILEALSLAASWRDVGRNASIPEDEEKEYQN